LHAPLSQTLPDAHVWPFIAELPVPVSVHTAAPVVHDHVPSSQMFAGATRVHPCPDGHALHAPLSQTLPEAHVVPFAAALAVPVSLHTCVPLLQSHLPSSQTFAGATRVHVCPDGHALQAPLSQTLPDAHVAPFCAGSAAPVSLHTGAPVVHASVPLSQTLAGATGVHPMPVEHVLQAPLSQTLPVAHVTPFCAGLAVFVSVHTAAPLVHTVVPLSQTFAGETSAHDVPAAHVLHAPLSQTLPDAQVVPFAAALAVFVSVHTGTPVPHVVVPRSHTFAGAASVHDDPATHDRHAPLSQTWPTPHVVPLAEAFGWPVSLHTDVPVAHDVTPTSHGLPGGEHDRFAVHATHWPTLQTWLVPQDVPSGAGPRSEQAIWPPEHDTEPWSQGLPVGTQPAPFVHGAHVPALQ